MLSNLPNKTEDPLFILSSVWNAVIVWGVFLRNKTRFFFFSDLNLNFLFRTCSTMLDGIFSTVLLLKIQLYMIIFTKYLPNIGIENSGQVDSLNNKFELQYSIVYLKTRILFPLCNLLFVSDLFSRRFSNSFLCRMFGRAIVKYGSSTSYLQTSQLASVNSPPSGRFRDSIELKLS